MLKKHTEISILKYSAFSAVNQQAFKSLLNAMINEKHYVDIDIGSY